MASMVVSRLMEVMQLRSHVSPLAPGQSSKQTVGPLGAHRSCSGQAPGTTRARGAKLELPDSVRRLCVQVAPGGPAWPIRHPNDEETVLCILRPPVNSDMMGMQLMRVSLAIGLSVQSRGGLLLHAALAERDGVGVILAGYGGAGKTTASQRFRPPWRSLCDDTTLIVHDDQGPYWAHPWPTWSKLLAGGQDSTWDVQHAVRIGGIFFLNQSQKERAEPVGAGQAVSLLVESTEQASGSMSYAMEEEVVRELRLQRFDSVCALARAVPCYLLNLSLTGAFWQEIERVLLEMDGDTP
jgi:SynChlorMet cassette protein ScmC